jgi:hypothetical protein
MPIYGYEILTDERPKGAIFEWRQGIHEPPL